MYLEVKDGTVAWVRGKSISESDVKKLTDKNFVVLLPNVLENYSPEDYEKWDIFAQELQKESKMIVFTSGDYRPDSIHIRGVIDNGALQYIIEDEICSVGLFSKIPSENLMKSYAPLDVLVGEGRILAKVQTDFEPFHVVLTSLTPEYSQESGVTDIKKSDKLVIKSISTSDREGIVTLSVTALE